MVPSQTSQTALTALFGTDLARENLDFEWCTSLAELVQWGVINCPPWASIVFARNDHPETPFRALLPSI